jgi:6-phosphofructokinase 1
MPNRIDFDPEALEVLEFLKSTSFLRSIETSEIEQFARHMQKCEYARDEIIYDEGEKASCAYLIEEGRVAFQRFGRNLKLFTGGELIGELPFFDDKPRTGTVRALEKSVLYRMDYELFERNDILECTSLLLLYKEMSRQVASYLRQEDALFKFMDVLLIEDGGCAPGKNPIVAFLTEYLEKAGRHVFITAEGYRSLVSGKDEDFRSLIYDATIFKHLDHIPGVVFAPPLRDARGANFRSERFPEFRDVELQKRAAENVARRHVNMIIGIGGNGTFGGLSSLCGHLPPEIQVFFIPVTIDSDVHGTDCIGQHTGVEAGAEKIRCYMADARTHHRCYIIEMMGAMGGFHALNSCIGAGAHLAVLPSSRCDMKKVVKALAEKDSAVIVVAEGYKKEERKEKCYAGNAGEYFRDELIAAGLNTKMKVICEPFSRDIRGASPNNLDIALTQRFARRITHLMKEGKSRVMPALLANRESEIPFEEIKTDNTKGAQFASLANRLY